MLEAAATSSSDARQILEIMYLSVVPMRASREYDSSGVFARAQMREIGAAFPEQTTLLKHLTFDNLRLESCESSTHNDKTCSNSQTRYDG